MFGSDVSLSLWFLVGGGEGEGRPLMDNYGVVMRWYVDAQQFVREYSVHRGAAGQQAEQQQDGDRRRCSDAARLHGSREFTWNLMGMLKMQCYNVHIILIYSIQI